MARSSREEVRRDNEAQIAEALSDFNKWVTGEAVGHEPTKSECLKHYIANGGAADFRRRIQAEQPSESSGQECQG